MSKFILFIFAVLVILSVITITATDTYALDKCFVYTDPTPLTNEAKKAEFIVGVDTLGGTAAFDSWKIEFICGLKGDKDAHPKGTDRISIELNNSGVPSPCEFSSGPHTLTVKGIYNNQLIPQCEATYSVLDAKSLCKLSIDPKTDITSKTSLTVSGTNLVKDGQFAVFVDNERITGNYVLPGLVSTPTFSGIQIPSKYMIPGPTPHKIDLRAWLGPNLPVRIQPLPLPFGLPGIPLIADIHTYHNPLCSLAFTVGTTTHPGSISAPGPAGIINWIPGIAAKAPPCDNDPQDPGIQTAIGCVHTSPVGFIKDFMTFVIAISGGLAFLMMLLGAFQMLTSAGNPDTLAAGRERLTSGVIGLLFIIFAVLLLKIIGFDILQIPGFQPS